MELDYLHGYTAAEHDRLLRQNQVLGPHIYQRIDFGEVSSVLEMGTGAGAQLVWLLDHYPHLRVTGIDRSPAQLQAARVHLSRGGYDPSRWNLIQADITDSHLPSHGDFDAGLMVWILEHLPDGRPALAEMQRLLQPNSLVVVTEVLNQSFYVSPAGTGIWQYWQRMNQLQQRLGGQPNAGALVGNWLAETGYQQIEVLPYSFCLDRRQPDARATMLTYWFELLASSFSSLQQAGVADAADFAAFQRDWQMLSLAEDAVFFFTFVQARARSAADARG